MRASMLAALVLLAACGSRDRPGEPIDGVPLARQQTISRARLGFRWPLSPGAGTVACADGGVILFRTGGVTYLVHGSRPGAADISPLRVPEASPPPSNPVRRLTQNVRMDAFASLERCLSGNPKDVCSRSLQGRFSLSDDEARRIEAEGLERRWPPLARGLMPLDALANAGRTLCSR